jgi:hypothetical protein
MSDKPVRDSGGSAPSPRLGPIGDASRPETIVPIRPRARAARPRGRSRYRLWLWLRLERAR